MRGSRVRWRPRRSTPPASRRPCPARAAGNYSTGTGSGGPLALHWTRTGYLADVVALSRTDSWAVGVVFNTSRMLLFRWNGTAWHQVRTPVELGCPDPD